MSEFIDKLDELKKRALSVEASTSIGIGITTHNRYDIFKKTFEEMKRFAPANAKIVVVDDASDTAVPEATLVMIAIEMKAMESIIARNVMNLMMAILQSIKTKH